MGSSGKSGCWRGKRAEIWIDFAFYFRPLCAMAGPGFTDFPGGNVKYWGIRGLPGLVLLWALLPTTAQAAWLQAKSRHFVIYSESNEAKLREFAQKLEKFDGLLRRVTGVDDPEAGSPVAIFLLNDEAKVMELARNRNVRGFYGTSERFAYAVLARGGKISDFDLGAEEVLFHEYTHHFMLHHFPAAYPAWYVEGFAEFFSVIKFLKDGAVQFGNIPQYRAPGLVLGSTYPLKQLLARDTKGLNAADGDRYYGTAWLLTHYFQYRVDRRQEIRLYLHDLADGVQNMQLDGYFAGGIDGLEKDLRAYMKKGLAASRVDATTLTVGDIEVRPVDEAQGALMEDELRLMQRPGKDKLPGIVRSIRQTAVKFPASAYALTVLAQAEALAEEKLAALVDLDRAIALAPGLSRAYSQKAQLLLERAADSDRAEDWKAALSAIVRANRTDLEDPLPLILFYRYHARRGGPMPQVGFDGLSKAFGLLPQNPDYRFAMAEALAREGHYAHASALLDPLAYSPHASELREAAVKRRPNMTCRSTGRP
jgi:hypothetical protein